MCIFNVIVRLRSRFSKHHPRRVQDRELDRQRRTIKKNIKN